jgi:hypothetical protein
VDQHQMRKIPSMQAKRKKNIVEKLNNFLTSGKPKNFPLIFSENIFHRCQQYCAEQTVAIKYIEGKFTFLIPV